MKAFVLLVFIPSLITADVLCPNSKTTCPEDKECCEVDGEYSCCDIGADPDDLVGRMKVFPGVEMMFPNASANVSLSGSNGPYDTCSYLTCSGTCCSTSIYACCQYSLADCCSGNKCCPSLNKCCGTGCCGALQKCCQNKGCCDMGYNCCESWCCKQGSRCGRNHNCIAKGVALSPQVVALFLMAASVFIYHRL